MESLRSILIEEPTRRQVADAASRRAARHVAAAIAGLLTPFMVSYAAEGTGEAATVYDSCMAKAVTSSDMQTCQQAGRADVERRLAAAYATALKGLAADQQAALRQSERLWITFRAADCGVFHGKDSGTEASVAAGECMISRAEHRIQELASFRP